MTNSTLTDAKKAAFLTSLGPKDRLIHELAAKMLKTRYTPERSLAWAAFVKKEKEKAKETQG